MEGGFASGLTSFPLFIEIKNNVDGLVTFSTASDNVLSQQLELILAEPIYEEPPQQVKIKQEIIDEDEEEDDTNIDVKDFLKLNNVKIEPDDQNMMNDNHNNDDNDEELNKNSNGFENITNDNTNTNDEKIYTCNDCSETFDTKEIYDIHLSGHANNMKCAICNMVLKSLKNYEKHCLRCKPYECQICGRVVRFRPNFIKHMRVHTTQTQSERHKYKCEVCQKEFMSFEYFKVHKKIHNENVNLTCDVCGKVFSALASLRGHTKLHTGIKLHKCDVCGKGFGQRYNLKIHSRVHTGEIPYECGICKRKMHTQSSYQTHMQTHQKHQGSQTTIINYNKRKNENSSLKVVKEIKLEINGNDDSYEDMKIKKNFKVERETQTVVQNIDKIRSKCIVIPTATATATKTKTSSSATTTTTVVSNALPNEIYNSFIIKNESTKMGPVELCRNNVIKYDTNLLKLNSMNPKINEIIITKNNNGNDNDDYNDDDDDDDDKNHINHNIILGKCTKILNTGDCNKFQNDFENDFIKTNNNDDDDDDLMVNSLSYTNIFETSAISNSITDGIYLHDHNNDDNDDDVNNFHNHHNFDHNNSLVDLQSTTITTTTNDNTTETTTDGNFIKKEWIYSNTNNYSSISKFNDDDDDDNDNEFSEAASFIYD